MTRESQAISIAIDCPYARAYALLAEPQNFAQWAEGLGQSLVQRSDGRWFAATPEGAAEVRFSPVNDFGVLDHWVHLPGGAVVYVPMRAIAIGEGACEVTLTLLRQPGMTDEKFAEDAAWVKRDLARLKRLLEGQD
jgi:hypothetical protein